MWSSCKIIRFWNVQILLNPLLSLRVLQCGKFSSFMLISCYKLDVETYSLNEFQLIQFSLFDLVSYRMLNCFLAPKKCKIFFLWNFWTQFKAASPFKRKSKTEEVFHQKKGLAKGLKGPELRRRDLSVLWLRGKEHPTLIIDVSVYQNICAKYQY